MQHLASDDDDNLVATKVANLGEPTTATSGPGNGTTPAGNGKLPLVVPVAAHLKLE